MASRPRRSLNKNSLDVQIPHSRVQTIDSDQPPCRECQPTARRKTEIGSVDKESESRSP
ncbi:uncharacterized protein Dere_GG27254 [Drosophila erecta]|nr:uncharacterized protein Dere_GG27254 [Drosophila erecta]